MYITFLVGNGFNASLGLRTSYADFYRYVNELDKDDKPELGANDILHSIETHFDNPDEKRWSDLELGLGSFTEKCSCNPEDYLKQKNEIETLLYDYLEKEQTKFNVDGMSEKELEKYVSIFKNSLVKFPHFFPPEDKKIIDSVISSYAENIRYNVIDFNYTNVVDDIWDLTLLKSRDNGALTGNNDTKIHSLGRLLHVHGELGIMPILGVDNIGQIANTEWRKNPAFAEMMVKERMNVIAKQNRTYQARRLINNSAIICIYGMSLGRTDQMWWQEIANWLSSNGTHKLVIFSHCKNRNDLTSSVYNKRMIENAQWNRFKENTSIEERKWQFIRDNVLIQNSMLIFDFPELNMNTN